MSTALHVLVVEDNEIDWIALTRRFRECGDRFLLARASTLSQGISLLETQTADHRFDCVVLDLNLPDGQGVDLLPRLRGTASVVMTGHGEAPVAVDAMKRGASDFLVKQTNGEHLALLPEVIERAHQQKCAEHELDRYRHELEEIVAERTENLQAEVERRVQIEADLKSLLEVKETLLQEVHHRVKNNLQIISSLLNLQIDSNEIPGGDELLAASNRRIQAMALVHEQIYQSSTLADVNLVEYLSELCELLADGYDGEHVQLHIEGKEVHVKLKTIIPIGLIAAELLSNAYKYAFEPGTLDPSIRVIGELNDDNALALTISDNGKGTPEDRIHGSGETLGLTIVHLLAEQLHGSVRHNDDGGTTWVITVPLDDGGVITAPPEQASHNHSALE